MLTLDEYKAITGENDAPEDFEACRDLALDVIHANTLHAYEGRLLDDLPAIVSTKFKRAVAFQTLSIIMAGGVASVSESQPASAGLGKFSYTDAHAQQKKARDVPLAPSAAELLPILTAFGRGLV